MLFGFVPLQEKQGAVQTHYVCMRSSLFRFLSSVIISVTLYALITNVARMSSLCRILWSPIPSEVCEKILPKNAEVYLYLRILTYYN